MYTLVSINQTIDRSTNGINPPNTIRNRPDLNTEYENWFDVLSQFSATSTFVGAYSNPNANGLSVSSTFTSAFVLTEEDYKNQHNEDLTYMQRLVDLLNEKYTTMVCDGLTFHFKFGLKTISGTLNSVIPGGDWGLDFQWITVKLVRISRYYATKYDYENDVGDLFEVVTKFRKQTLFCTRDHDETNKMVLYNYFDLADLPDIVVRRVGASGAVLKETPLFNYKVDPGHFRYEQPNNVQTKLDIWVKIKAPVILDFPLKAWSYGVGWLDDSLTDKITCQQPTTEELNKLEGALEIIQFNKEELFQFYPFAPRIFNYVNGIRTSTSSTSLDIDLSAHTATIAPSDAVTQDIVYVSNVPIV